MAPTPTQPFSLEVSPTCHLSRTPPHPAFLSYLVTKSWRIHLSQYVQPDRLPAWPPLPPHLSPAPGPDAHTASSRDMAGLLQPHAPSPACVTCLHGISKHTSVPDPQSSATAPCGAGRSPWLHRAGRLHVDPREREKGRRAREAGEGVAAGSGLSPTHRGP